MLTEAQQLLVVRTELDEIFYAKFNTIENFPNFASAQTGGIFKVINSTNAGHFTADFKGVSLFANVGETEVVPEDQSFVTNKRFVQNADFAKDIYISKDYFDDRLSMLLSFINKMALSF